MSSPDRTSFAQICEDAQTNPEAFWAAAAMAIDWSRPWDQVVDATDYSARWFVGGEMNTCWNAIDRHVANGRGEQAALIYDSPVTGTVSSFTFTEMRDRIARCAGALRNLGVAKGDRVIIYMPMIPESVIATLACARLGAIHSIVFGGFAAKELSSRIDHAQPKLIISASCGIEPSRTIAYKPMLDDAIAQSSHKPEHCLVLQREQGPRSTMGPQDVDWDSAMTSAEPVDCVPVAATDPLYILYTSGTTGNPKGVVRDNGGHAVALAWAMRAVYGMEPGEVFWAASDIGWTVGHTLLIYGPLILGCTALLYEGKPVDTPDASAFWRVISQHNVKGMIAAPTAFRAIRREDSNARLLDPWRPLPLRAMFLAGERSDPDTLQWLESHLKLPVIDHWWQTETGAPAVGNLMGMNPIETRHGTAGKPLPGWSLAVLDEAGNQCPAGAIGNLVCRLPLAPASFTTLWRANDQYRERYFDRFPGYYDTSDSGLIDEDGYVHFLSRTDDIINVAGHRLSTAAIEEVLISHAAVAECAVVGVRDELKGQLPVGFLVLTRAHKGAAEEICEEVIGDVRRLIGPVAAFRTAVVVDRLPKTRSGKILRASLRSIAQGDPWEVPATIEDPGVLTEIAQMMAGTAPKNRDLSTSDQAPNQGLPFAMQVGGDVP